MSVELPNGKVALTLPEQVGKNAINIEKIFQLIDGLDIQDNVVAIDDMSHIMTSQELSVVRQAVSFIIYDGQLYIKKSESSGFAYFDIVFAITSGTAITFNSKEIQVNLSNGALGITLLTVSTYSTTQIDTKVGAKADITYVDTELAKKANLSGASFTGGISAPEILETMTGYGIQKQTTTKGVLDLFYSGAVKTGNKLTIANALYFTRGTGASGGMSIVRILMPQAIIAKIVPADEVSTSLIYNQFLLATPEGGGNPVQVIGNIVKYDSNSIYVALRDLSPLTEGVKYYIRQEATFLLGDNLAA